MASGPEFSVVSKNCIARHLVVDDADTEKLLGWRMLFDRGNVRGMPDALAQMTDAEWRLAMGEMVPGLADISMIMVPSSTGRVLDHGKPIATSGRHYYVHIKDGSDLERFGAMLLQRSFLHGYGF